MKLINKKNIPFTTKIFFDENYDLITPVNTEKFQIGLFDHLLSEEEVIEFYESNSVERNFSTNEMNYLNFIAEVYESCLTQIFIEIEMDEFTNPKIIEILNNLDYEDKNIWIEFVKKIDSAKSKLVEIDSKKELEMFFKIITRELNSPIFHFEDGKVNLLGNFDLFFPMFFESKLLVNKYREIALRNNLHILKIENKH